MWHLGFVVPSSPSLQLQSPYCFNYWWHLVAKKNITFDTSSSDCCSLTMTPCSREVPFYDKSKSKLINIKKKGTFILFSCSPFGPCMDSEILPAPSWIRPSKSCTTNSWTRARYYYIVLQAHRWWWLPTYGR